MEVGDKNEMKQLHKVLSKKFANSRNNVFLTSGMWLTESGDIIDMNDDDAYRSRVREESKNSPNIYGSQQHTEYNQLSIKEDWSSEIKSLEGFFRKTNLPEEIQLDEHSKISNCSAFVSSHLDMLRKNNGKYAYKPYLMRLRKLKTLLWM